MKITSFAISLNVDDAAGSVAFAKVTDPSGVVIQLVQWMTEPQSEAT